MKKLIIICIVLYGLVFLCKIYKVQEKVENYQLSENPVIQDSKQDINNVNNDTICVKEVINRTFTYYPRNTAVDKNGKDVYYTKALGLGYNAPGAFIRVYSDTALLNLIDTFSIDYHKMPNPNADEKAHILAKKYIANKEY